MASELVDEVDEVAAVAEAKADEDEDKDEDKEKCEEQVGAANGEEGENADEPDSLARCRSPASALGTTSPVAALGSTGLWLACNSAPPKEELRILRR